MARGDSIQIDGEKGKCLVVHGLTASTEEVEDLCNFLGKQGMMVSAPLLAGHNRDFRDLSRTTWEDWYRTIESAYAGGHVIGLSIGAILAIHLAANTRVKTLSLLSPAMRYSNMSIKFAPVVQHLIKYRKKNYSRFYPHRKESHADIVDERAFNKRIAYKSVSVRALSESLKLIKVVRKELATIDVPCLIIHSAGDHTASMQGAEYIYRRISSSQKRFVRLTRSGHIITADLEKERVFREVYDWQDQR